MNPFQTSEIGRTGLRVPRLGLGGAPLGFLSADLSDRRAVATIRRALAVGIGYVDTAPAYGNGRSELRYGRALASVPRNTYVISTKVGWLLKGPDEIDFSRISLRNLPELTRPFDFSRDGILRSLEQSLQRLRLETVDIVFLHSVPDEHYKQAVKEAYPTLAELRSQGVIKAIGAGMSNIRLLVRLALEGDFDCFLLAERYTLLDQSALSEFLPLCLEKGISIIMATPYEGGRIFGRGYYVPDLNPTPPAIEEQVRRLRAVCDRHKIPVGAVAIQFVSAHPAVVSVIPGPRSVNEVRDNIRMAQYPIPAELWSDLRQEGLIPSEAPTP